MFSDPEFLKALNKTLQKILVTTCRLISWINLSQIKIELRLRYILVVNFLTSSGNGIRIPF